MAGTPTWRARRMCSAVCAWGRPRRKRRDRSVHLGAPVIISSHNRRGRAVDVRVVALFGLVLDVGGIDRDAALFFFRSSVNLVVALGLGKALLGKDVVIAAVSVVLPWSTWPMVPTLTCGLVRSN